MICEFALLAATSITTVSPRRLRMAELQSSYSFTVNTKADLVLEELYTRIDRLLGDNDNYEAGEPSPSLHAVSTLKSFLRRANLSGAPTPEFSTYYGELDATWRRESKIVRLISFSDTREPLLYFCTDTGEPLARGETIQPVKIAQFNEKIQWLIR